MPKSDTQFKPGQSGNPAGRPKGSRSKLSEAFLLALADDFENNGVDAVKKVREEKPEAYLNTIGRLMPKLMELTGKDGDDITVYQKVERLIVNGDTSDTDS